MLDSKSKLGREWCYRSWILFLSFILFQGCATATSSQFSTTQHVPQRSTKLTAIIIIDDTLDKSNTPVIAGWMVYAGTRALWIEEKFFKTFPGQESYRYSFSEELDARKNLVDFWVSLRQKPPSPVNLYFDQLVDVDRAGFLSEYVWENFFSDQWWEKPDGLRLDEFRNWERGNQPGHKAQTRAIAKPREL